MRKEYDFAGAQRSKDDVAHRTPLPATTARGKTRITIFLDNDVLTAFRARAENEGKGYQTLINAALRAVVTSEAAAVDAMRRVLREGGGTG